MASGATYRQMRPEEEDAAFDLWMATWPGGDPERRRRTLHSDPRYIERTYIASGEDGQVLATAHYWVREMCDTGGRPRRVGCVSHVTTRHTARRQGHARTLMNMLQGAMAAEGCDYTLLFSSEMGVPLYEDLGYHIVSSPYRRGLVQHDRPPYAGPYAVRETREPDWTAIASIYAAYNAGRPLAFVREELYWREFFGPRWDYAMEHQGGRVFMAYASGATDDPPVGYVLAHFSKREYAREQFGLDRMFTICEVCALPGHDDAIRPLVDAAASVMLPGEVGGRVYAPRDDQTATAAIESTFGDTLNDVQDRRMMVRPLAGAINYAELEAMFASPASVFWLLDEF